MWQPQRLGIICVAMLIAAGCDYVGVASVASDGTQSDAASSQPDVSTDGRYVVFESSATTLGDNSAGHQQVWRRDLKTNTTLLVSGAAGCAGAGCAGASGTSRRPTVSDDGRYVVFSSTASDLIGATVTAHEQVYRADMQTGTHQPVSVTPTGSTGNGQSTLLRGEVSASSLSGDGDTVVFRSSATDLGPGGSGTFDLFVHTVSTDTTVLLTTDDHIDSFELSDDGSRVVVGVLQQVVDEPSSTITFVSSVRVYESDGSASIPVLSAFSDDPPGKVISHSVIDGDGSHVLLTLAELDVPLFPPPSVYRLFDLSSGTAVQSAFGYTQSTFQDTAVDLSPDATHALIHRFQGSRTHRCPTAALQACLDGTPTFAATGGLGVSAAHTTPVVSDDGRVFAFVTTSALPLVGDTNGVADVYVAAHPVGIAGVQLDQPLVPGSSATVTITGFGFAPGDTSVTAGRSPDAKIRVGRVNVISATTLTAVLTADVAAVPSVVPLTVVVTNPNLPSGAFSFDRCLSCITVDPAP